MHVRVCVYVFVCVCVREREKEREREREYEKEGVYVHILLFDISCDYRVAKMHKMPYLYRIFSAKKPYN